MHPRLASAFALASFSLLGLTREVRAQGAPAQAPGDAPAATGGAAPAPQSTPAPAGGAAAPGAAVYTPPYGFPSSDYNPNAHLPTSSQPSLDINKPSDGFDLAPKTEGPGIMR